MRIGGLQIRIAFPVYSLALAGGNKVIVRLADALERRGHDVSVLMPKTNAPPALHTKAKVHEVPILPIPRKMAGAKLLAMTFPFGRRLREFDVVIANYAPTALPTKMAGGWNTRRYYLVQHDEATFFSPWTMVGLVTRLGYRAFEEGRYFVVSKWLQDMIRKRSGHGSILVPPGIDHDVFYPRKRSVHSGKEVLFFARPQPWRGIQVLLKAMEIVRKEIPDVRLVAVGGTQGQYQTSCDIVHVRPSDEELANLYASCDVFVLPSFLEGLPVPPLEVMACGGAVVLTDCMGTRDYAEDRRNCLMVPPRDSDALAKAITRVLSDQNLSENLRKIGPLSAAPWTYERMVRPFVEEIEASDSLR